MHNLLLRCYNTTTLRLCKKESMVGGELWLAFVKILGIIQKRLLLLTADVPQGRRQGSAAARTDT